MISRSPHGRIDVLFGPVVTTEADLAFSGVRTHSNKTAEMTAIPVARDANSCIYYDSKHAAGVCLGTIHPAHMSSWHLHVSGRRYAPNTGYGLPCDFAPNLFFPRMYFSFQEKQWKSPTSPVSTASSFGEYFAQNMWNPLIVLLRRRNRLGSNFCP